jgi:hypothetical protein
MFIRPRVQIEIELDNYNYVKDKLSLNDKLSYITKYDTHYISNHFSKVVGNQRKQQYFYTNQNVFSQGIPFILDKQKK